jgi:hypothetical protein
VNKQTRHHCSLIFFGDARRRLLSTVLVTLFLLYRFRISLTPLRRRTTAFSQTQVPSRDQRYNFVKMTNCNNLNVDQQRLSPVVRNPHTFGLRPLRSPQPDSPSSAQNTSRHEFIASVLTQALELGDELQRLLQADFPAESRSEDISSTNNMRQETRHEDDEDEGKMLQ